MKYRRFEPLDRDLSVLVLGSMVCHTSRLEESFAILDAWLAAGGNVIDTAHLYSGGASERAIGLWLEARGCRDRIVILTKGAHHNPDRRRVTPEDIACDLRDSLVRLRTGCVDLYVLHRDDPNVPVGPIVEALNEHARAGRIRAFGGSNWTPERLEAANEYAARHGLLPFTLSSPHLSLAVPNGEIWEGCVDARGAADREWYRRARMPMFPWSAQARGFFSGRHRPGEVTDETVARVYDSPGNWERLRRATELGERRGFRAIEVALAWVLAQPFPCYPLIGPANPEELASSLRALDLSLSPAELDWLDLETDARPG